MSSSFSRSKITSLCLSLALLSIVLCYEACSPMKSFKETAGIDTSSTNICSKAYDPPSDLKAKATKASAPFIFDIQKVHLDSQLHSKAATLQNVEIIVAVDMICSSTPNSLSQKVLAQNSTKKFSLASHALPYVVEEPLSLDELTNLAEEDPCVIGVTPPGNLTASALLLPSSTDAYIESQSHLEVLNYAHAYQYLVKKRTTGIKAKVGFVDTGGDCTHSDLQSNYTPGCGFDAINGVSTVDNDGHGSHVTGIVGAVTDNGVGILGIAGNGAEVYAIKVIDVSTGTVQSAYDGIQYAIAQNLDVINISLESQVRLPLIEQGVQEAVNAGIVVVLAAGNHGKALGTQVEVSPAMVGKDLDGAITVGSMDSSTQLLSFFSNYGEYVEIVATGALNGKQSSDKGGIFSTNKDGTYKRLMGTSQAAPVVAGAAALLIQFFKEKGVSYTPADIENIIKKSSVVNSSFKTQGNRALNFSKLTRNAYKYANIELCEASAKK
jgi:subtilisin family serine protease